MNTKEAIKLIKKTMPHLWIETREALETLIPELKESEDERIRKRVIEQMELWHECALENNVVQDIKDSADAISYLEKQKEQKQEWSKEDKKMLNLCEDFMKEFHSIEASMVKDWLKTRIKSLCHQPHWKPSKEQMEALVYFIRSWGESGTMSPQNTILCAANSLLYDLKKLMED